MGPWYGQGEVAGRNKTSSGHISKRVKLILVRVKRKNQQALEHNELEQK